MTQLERTLFYSAILGALFMGGNLLAQSGSGGANGLAFLKIGAGARAGAMGDAYVAVSDDATATYWNPAALGNITRAHIAFSHTEWLQDVQHEYLAVTFPALGGGFGFSAYGVSVDGIERRVTASTQPISTFQANSLAAGVSYGRSLNSSLSLGLSAKYVYEKELIESASGYAFDFGLSYRLRNLPANIAVVAQNLGSMSALRVESSSLPTLIRFGGAYEVELKSAAAQLVLAAEGVKVLDAESWFSAGAELRLKKRLLLRFGYQSGIDEKGISGGFGVQFRRYHLNYGFTPFGANLGNAQRFSFGLDL